MEDYTYNNVGDRIDMVQEPLVEATAVSSGSRLFYNRGNDLQLFDSCEDVMKPNADGFWHTSDGAVYQYMPGTPQTWEEAMSDLKQAEKDYDEGKWMTWDDIETGIERIRRQYAEQNTHIA